MMPKMQMVALVPEVGKNAADPPHGGGKQESSSDHEKKKPGISLLQLLNQIHKQFDQKREIGNRIFCGAHGEFAIFIPSPMLTAGKRIALVKPEAGAPSARRP